MILLVFPTYIVSQSSQKIQLMQLMFKEMQVLKKMQASNF